MIVPTKGVPPQRALLTVGGEIVEALDEPKTVSRLWNDIRDRHSDPDTDSISFDWFVLALDLTHCLGAVQLGDDGFLERAAS